LLCLAFAVSLRAEEPAPADSNEYTPEQMDELVAHIALYPDALIAIILPAATVPGDLVLAARYLTANNDPALIPNQSWDDSVKALANYPEVIQWMNDNLDWSTALGRAFVLQPSLVMESVQQLRALARANGALVDTPQQNVVLDGSSILIQPTTADSISIPAYDPNLVFGNQTTVFPESNISYSQPYAVGPWLSYECDWDDYGIWRGTWVPGWVYIRYWRVQRPELETGRFWRPDPDRRREIIRSIIIHPVEPPPRPRVMSRAPNAERAAPVRFHPGTSGPPSRPDPTGWRLDSNGRLAVPPRPNLSTSRTNNKAPATAAPANLPPRQNRAPDLGDIRPEGSVPAQPVKPALTTSTSSPAKAALESKNHPADISEIRPQGSSPAQSIKPSATVTAAQPARGTPASTNRAANIAEAHPPSPAPAISSSSPVVKTRIAPSTDAPRIPTVPEKPLAPGPAFGSYTRGTTAQDYSDRGQASRAIISPPPVSTPTPPPRPAPPAPRTAPVAPAPRQVPTSTPAATPTSESKRTTTLITP